MKFIGQTTFFLLLTGIAITSIGANPKTEGDEATLDYQWQKLDNGRTKMEKATAQMSFFLKTAIFPTKSQF